MLGFVLCYSKVSGGCVKATSKGIPKKQTNLKKTAFSSRLSSCNPMNDESSFKVDCEGQIVTHNGVKSFSKKNYFLYINIPVFTKEDNVKIKLGKPGSKRPGRFF